MAIVALITAEPAGKASIVYWSADEAKWVNTKWGTILIYVSKALITVITAITGIVWNQKFDQTACS